MPPMLEKCVSEVMAKGHDQKSAWAICKTSMGLIQDETKAIENALKIAEDLKDGKKKVDFIKNFYLSETKDINEVEIFASGTWNGDKYTQKDLDEMVNAFDQTKGEMKPYLKLGHDDKQKMAQQDGYPALGWVENLKRVGDKLVADFKRIPEKIYDLITAGAYRRVSSEIFINMTVGDKKYPKMLKAVALLGGDTPAVHNLRDIISLYASSDQIVSYSDSQDVKSYEVEISELLKENKNMKTIEEVKAELAESQRNLAEAQAKISKLEKEDIAQLTQKVQTLEKEKSDFEKKVSDQESQISKYMDETHQAKVNADIDKLIKEKKILPAQKEEAFTMLYDALKSPSEKKFKVKEGDKEKEVSHYEHTLLFMSKGSVDVNTKQRSEAGARQDEDQDMVKATKYIEQKKAEGVTVTLREAMIAVSPEKKTEE